MSDFIGTKLTMNLGERSYDIILKNGALENLYQFARLDRRVAVVTDSGVPAQYAARQPNRAILRKNRGPCFQRTPVFGYGMDGFSLLQTHKQMVYRLITSGRGRRWCSRCR